MLDYYFILPYRLNFDTIIYKCIFIIKKIKIKNKNKINKIKTE